MKLWHVLVLLALLVVAALLIAIIWGWIAPFYLNAALLILLGIVLLSLASRFSARGKSYGEFLNLNLRIASFYTAFGRERRDQARKKDEEELSPFHF